MDVRFTIYEGPEEKFIGSTTTVQFAKECAKALKDLNPKQFYLIEITNGTEELYIYSTLNEEEIEK